MPSVLSDCQTMPTATHISVAIPMMDELDNLDCLLSLLRRQRHKNFTIYICVNQPEAWHTAGDEYQKSVVANNGETLKRLATVKDLDMEVLDCSSKGRGWSPKRQGVGWARKVLFYG